MTEADQITAIARERADKRIDTALGALHKAALEIGKKHGIPEGIAGHSIDELLGRMAYIPTMARDLRRACGQELAKSEINKMMDGSEPIVDRSAPAELYGAGPIVHQKIEPSKIPGNIPVGMDVGALEGISVQTINALREAGLTKVGDIMDVPDAHLIKQQGLGEKSVAHIRAAIAKASETSA